jgi:hypothetical protein
VEQALRILLGGQEQGAGIATHFPQEQVQVRKDAEQIVEASEKSATATILPKTPEQRTAEDIINQAMQTTPATPESAAAPKVVEAEGSLTDAFNGLTFDD